MLPVGLLHVGADLLCRETVSTSPQDS
jgi:hypothetical protein